MTTTSAELNKIWPELTDIFMSYTNFNSRTAKRLTAIGFGINRCNNHIKIIMPVGTMIISSTPSDNQAGRQILRQIRRMYENKN